MNKETLSKWGWDEITDSIDRHLAPVLPDSDTPKPVFINGFKEGGLEQEVLIDYIVNSMQGHIHSSSSKLGFEKLQLPDPELDKNLTLLRSNHIFYPELQTLLIFSIPSWKSFIEDPWQHKTFETIRELSNHSILLFSLGPKQRNKRDELRARIEQNINNVFGNTATLSLNSNYTSEQLTSIGVSLIEDNLWSIDVTEDFINLFHDIIVQKRIQTPDQVNDFLYSFRSSYPSPLLTVRELKYMAPELFIKEVSYNV